jgi:hypothetical protein
MNILSGIVRDCLLSQYLRLNFGRGTGNREVFRVLSRCLQANSNTVPLLGHAARFQFVIPLLHDLETESVVNNSQLHL